MNMAFLSVSPFSSKKARNFEEKYCLQLQGRKVKQARNLLSDYSPSLVMTSTTLWNIGGPLPDYTALHPITSAKQTHLTMQTISEGRRRTYEDLTSSNVTINELKFMKGLSFGAASHGIKSPDPHGGRPGSIAGQVTWDLRWTNLHRRGLPPCTSVSLIDFNSTKVRHIINHVIRRYTR
jgi:hypothetical protein